MKTDNAEPDVGVGTKEICTPVDRGTAAGKSSLNVGPLLHRSECDLEVHEVTTRRDLDRFIKLPWRIYAGDENWSPPLLVEAKAFLNRRRHPFYLHGQATQFLAYREHECVGRILVSDDPHYNADQGTNLGCFGMFECSEDPQVANALLEAAADWLRGRGRTEIMGPIDYSMNYPCGLLIDGFDTPQRVMMNHNPPFYAALLEGWGLEKAKDLYAWWFDDSFDMLSRWAGRASRLADRARVRIRPLSLRNFDEEVARCNALYSEACDHNWGFVRMSHAEFQHLAKQLRQFAVPEWVLIAEVDGQPAGICITIPDFNEATRTTKRSIDTLRPADWPTTANSQPTADSRRLACSC